MCATTSCAAGHGGFEERALFRFLGTEFTTFPPFLRKLHADHGEEHALAALIKSMSQAPIRKASSTVCPRGESWVVGCGSLAHALSKIVHNPSCRQAQRSRA